MADEYAPHVVADLEQMVSREKGRWGLSSATTLRLLNLSENATFALSDPASGRELVLRLHRVGYSSPQEIESELAWIDALRRDAVIETAAPVAALDGARVLRLESPSGAPPRHAVAFEWLAGSEPDASGDATPWFERLGELSAKMHRHARSWVRPAHFCRKRWDLAAMVGPAAYWGSWREGIGLDAAGARELEHALGYIAQRLERFGMGAERFGLVHADLRLANLLVDGAQLRIIDFDDCGFSWFLYDFATAVSFIEHQPMVPQLLRAWVRGYRRMGALSEEERSEMPTFVVLRRILLTAWLASHREVPFARQFGATHTRDTVRLAQQLLQGQFLATRSSARGE
jgi:Ser/Thr protein kinase RdoA (MazF antagonist)